MKQGYTQLKTYFQDLEEVVIAYNGSVESTLLLKVAYDELGDEVIALMGRSKSMGEREFENALYTAFEIGITPVVLDVRDDLSDLYETFYNYINQNKLLHLVDGVFDTVAENIETGKNIDIIYPLRDIGFSFDDICNLSKELGLSVWRRNYLLNEKDQSYSSITSELLEQLDKAEELLKVMDFTQVNVRLQNDTLKVEVNPNEVYRFYEEGVRKEVLNKMKDLGFQYVSVDMVPKKSLRKNVAYA